MTYISVQWSSSVFLNNDVLVKSVSVTYYMAGYSSEAELGWWRTVF